MPRQLLFLFCFFVFGMANGQQYNFRNYSVSDGLAQSQVYCMTEDSRGYLWLGTRGGGLSRFDGNEFQTFTEDDSLPSNFISCLATDKQGNVWIGTDDGPCVFDGKKFKPVSFPGSNSPINDIHCDAQGNTWIATNDTGIVKWRDGKISKHWTYGKGLLSKRVYCLFEETDGSIWAGTEQGPVHIVNDKTRIYGRKEGFPAAGVRAISRDGKGQLWFATYGGGLCRLNKSDEVFRFMLQDGLTNNTTHCMITDKQGRLWIGTATGVTRKDGNEVKQFTELEGLCSNVVMSVLEDSWGNIWFGTSGGGVCRLDGERFIHFNEKSGDMGTWVYTVHCDRNGHFWFGTSSGGVTEYDGNYYTNYYEGAGFTSAKVRSIGEDTTGALWFGTVGEGAYRMDKGTFTHFRRSDGLTSNYVTGFITDSLNREWMATAGGGICIWDSKQERFLHVGKEEGLTHNRVLALVKDQDGTIWACSTEGGVFEMNYDSLGAKVKKNYNTKEGLQSTTVRSATCDRYGNMWFGTAGGGVSRLSNDKTKFINYSKKDGLASNNIYLLIADKQGFIWIGTEKGLDKISYDSEGKITSLKHYGKGEGLNGIETSQNAAALDTGSGIWFGTISGASAYFSKNDYETKEPPQVHITGIRLFFDPIENTPYGKPGKSNWFNIPDTLELPHTQNHLRFEFTGIDLRNPEGVRFRWKMIGFDNDWTPENNERQAIYSNLPPGDYEFQLQARNSDGFWSEVRSFSFRITPPIWATWPFRLAAALILILLIVALFRWRVRNLKKRNRTAVEKLKMEKHVLELEQKALRLQMNPHFIFNALQSIQGFIARNDSAEARRYLAKFGKLMRLTLDNSRQSYTSIEQETESLQHYLELEALCHGQRFSYKIEIDERLNAEATFIPVMLIQPFVENAVLHGMVHLDEKQGLIVIRFIREGESIICEVEDNGVGRKRAAELIADVRKDHKSAAMTITRERLAQLNEKGKPVSSIHLTDLKDSNGNGCGTKVVFRIGNVVFEG
jgi:ligand-binding sensor domain-containing protein